MRQRHLDAFDAVLDLLGVAGEDLSEGNGRGVLAVCASDFYYGGELRSLRVEGSVEVLQRRDEFVGDLRVRRDAHGSGERVVGRHSHVAVVVGVDGVLGADLAAEHLDGAVREDFVHVHVGLGAAAGLVDDEGKVGVELSGDHLVGGGHDGFADVLGELALLHVVLGAALLQGGHAADDGEGHLRGLSADGKVHDRPRGLSTVELVAGDLKRPEGVGLGSSRHEAGEAGGADARAGC
mmetsp:Transcript_7272/g.13084  ORF Transcript_7272/g.13084 Transcript_7272/m.13084 type:complete len:237 (-) Transcript_7272:39-749(-)